MKKKSVVRNKFVTHTHTHTHTHTQTCTFVVDLKRTFSGERERGDGGRGGEKS